jgi:hypothetical protein
MYIARTRKLGDNRSTQPSSTARPVAGAAPPAISRSESGKDLLAKADGVLADACKQLTVSAPLGKACIAAYATLKKPKLSARDRKLAELDEFYNANKEPGQVVVAGSFVLESPPDRPI